MSTSTPPANPPPSHTSQMRSFLHSIIPHLTSSSHKGQAGRLCVVGGSSAYTGAPYFAAMTTLKLGADLVTVLCSIEAATPIKTYSPELMTRPTLIPSHLLSSPGLHPHWQPASSPPSAVIPRILADVKADVIDRSNVLIVGPGLGKDDPLILDTVAALLAAARASHIPLILDGDGLHLATHPTHRHIITGYPQAILTPNAAEFRRLWEAHLPSSSPPPLCPCQWTARCCPL